MNKKVLTVAQVRAIFKNYSLGLALAGVALTAGKCKDATEGKTTTENKKGGSTTDAEAVKKADLDAFAKKSEFGDELSSDAILTIAGKSVNFGSLKGIALSDKELSALLNEKGWGVVDGKAKFTSGASDKTFAQVMGGSGLSEKQVAEMFVSDARDWEYSSGSSGKSAEIKKAPSQGSGIPFAEALKKFLNISTHAPVTGFEVDNDITASDNKFKQKTLTGAAKSDNKKEVVNFAEEAVNVATRIKALEKVNPDSTVDWEAVDSAIKKVTDQASVIAKANTKFSVYNLIKAGAKFKGELYINDSNKLDDLLADSQTKIAIKTHLIQNSQAINIGDLFLLSSDTGSHFILVNSLMEETDDKPSSNAVSVLLTNGSGWALKNVGGSSKDTGTPKVQGTKEKAKSNV